MCEYVFTFNLNTLKSLKVHKIADSAALNLVARCERFVCWGGVWLSTPC
jgi:hypothetical protein